MPIQFSGTLPGTKWRMTHQVTVNSVLGADPTSPKYRKVTSKGSAFFNRDTWYARKFGANLCEWARLNKEVQPTRYDVEVWLRHSVQDALAFEVDRGITIAATPDDLRPELAMALVGGAYHEAWHTEYSRRTPISIMEVWPKLQELWAKIPWAPERGYRGWSKLTKQLMTWSNIIEDIRIERLGCVEFPGAPDKMEALQDLILSMEARGKSIAENDAEVFIRTVQGAFRDLGLGYQTSLQRQVLEKYSVASPEAWRLVTKGALRPILDQAIRLGKEDSLGSLWLAMEVLVVLADLAAPEAARKWAEKNKPPEGDVPAPPAPAPAPPEEEPKVVDQADATPDDDEEEGSGAPQPVVTKKPPLYKVGDVVRVKAGPHAGCKAEVVRASLPNPETGIQDLELALVVDDDQV